MSIRYCDRRSGSDRRVRLRRCRRSASPAVPSAPVAAAAGARYRDLGRAPAQMPVRLAVVLAYRNENELQALLAAQEDAASPLAGRYLTQQQFLDAFAPSPATYAAVERDFAARGFTIERTYANRTVLDVAAPAAIVERTFATELHRASALGRSGYANVSAAFLPAELRERVAGVVGFDSVGVLHTANHRGAAQKNALGPPLQGPDTGFSPFALAGAYDLPGAAWEGRTRAIGRRRNRCGFSRYRSRAVLERRSAKRERGRRRRAFRSTADRSRR